MELINSTSSLSMKDQQQANVFLDVSRYSAIVGVTLGPFSTALMSVCCVLMVLSWLVSRQALPLLKEAMSQPVAKALALFFLVLIIGVFYSVVDIKTGIHTLWSWRKLAYIFILLGLFNSVYWKERFITFFLIGMVLALFLSYLAWFEIVPSKNQLGILASNYTQQSMAFVVATIFLIVRVKEASIKLKYLYIILILLFVINILYVSQSRTGYIALVSGGLVASLYVLGKKNSHIVIGGVIVLLAIVAFSSKILQERVTKGILELKTYQTSPVLTSIGVRALFAENTINIIKKKPIIGYGTGSFEVIYAEEIADKYSGWRAKATTDPHNQYLYVLAENGVIGFLSFLGFISIVIRQGFVTDKYGVMAASIMVAWVLASLFNSTFKTFIEGHLLGLVLGAMLAMIPTHNSK